MKHYRYEDIDDATMFWPDSVWWYEITETFLDIKIMTGLEFICIYVCLTCSILQWSALSGDRLYLQNSPGCYEDLCHLD